MSEIPQRQQDQKIQKDQRQQLCTAFCLSGAAGLIFQVAWMKSLVLVFGATVYAVTTVLVAFMGGLGLGSWLLARKLENHPHPARAYALLEFGAGVSGALTFAAIPMLAPLYVSLGGGMVVRFLLSVALLLIPTFLMGGTLPLLVRVFREGASETGQPVARLYALNTLGAVAGTVAAGFVLLPTLGLWQTGVVAAACNLAAGAIAWLVPPAPQSEIQTRQSAIRNPQLLAVSFLSGATAMMLEIAWTRRLSAPLGGSTYAFTVILAVFLVGIAVGSRAFTRIAARVTVNREGLGVLQLAIVLAAVLAVALWAGLPAFVFVLMEGMAGSFVGLLLLQFIAAFLILLPVTLLYGLGFPWLAQLYAPEEHGVGTNIGRLYAVNTGGAIIGSMVAGFVLVPLIGSYATLAVAAILSAVCAFLLLPRARWAPAFGLLALLVAVSIAGRLFTLTPVDQEAVIPSFFHNDLYRSGLRLAEIADMQDYVFMEDGLNASVAVAVAERYHALKVNGRVNASDLDMKTQAMLAALPLSMHAAPKHVLVIGFGGGTTTRIAAMWPGVERVDTVEIEPAVVRAGEFLKELNGGVQHWRNSNVIVDDARHYLFTTREHYDVIISEPANAWLAGVGNLLTAEFYREAQRHLNTGGIFLQWMQAYQLLPEDLALVARTMATVFPQMSLWRGEETDVLLVGSQGPHTLVPRALSPELDELLRTILLIDEPVAMWAYHLLSDADLKVFAGQGELNTDNHPLLEYRAPLRLVGPSDSTVPLAVSAARREGWPVKLSNEQTLAVAWTLLLLNEVEWSRMVARPLFPLMRDRAEIWLYDGEVNRILKNYKAAESSFGSALERGGDVRAKAGLAMVAYETGDPQAEKLLRDAIAAGPSPQHSWLCFALARNLAYQEHWADAVEAQQQGLGDDAPRMATAWAQLGDLYLRSGRGADAKKAFDKALAMDKYNYSAHQILGEFFLSSGLYKESAQEFRFLVRYYPLGDPSLYPKAADALRRTGDASAANRMEAKGRRLFPPAETHANVPQ